MKNYLKFLIPILHRQFFETLSQNPENVKTHCNDMSNQFHSEWFIGYRKIAQKIVFIAPHNRIVL